MKKSYGWVALAAVFVLGGAPAAVAQGSSPAGPVWVASASIGGQLPARTVGASTNFLLFDELATVTASQSVSTGLLGDLGVDRRVWHHISVGASLDAFRSRSSDTPFTASIPDPLVFRNPSVLSGTATGTSQTAIGLNLRVGYTRPVSEKLDVSLFAGPTILYVRQEFPSVLPGSGAQAVTSSIVSESTATAKAANAGVELAYKINRRYGAGMFLRYAGGTVDLPSASTMHVGGVQVGGGLRIRF